MTTTSGLLGATQHPQSECLDGEHQPITQLTGRHIVYRSRGAKVKRHSTLLRVTHFIHFTACRPTVHGFSRSSHRRDFSATLNGNSRGNSCKTQPKHWRDVSRIFFVIPDREKMLQNVLAGSLENWPELGGRKINLKHLQNTFAMHVG